MAKSKPVRFPVPVLIDTREQLPYTFAGLRADKREGGGPLIVETRSETLHSGDYSILGYAGRVAIERKSLADLFRTIGSDRERFERELSRLAEYDYAAVMVEAEWSEVLNDPPSRSKLSPKTIFRSVMAWQCRYPRVHWWFVPGRDMGEVATLRLLEKYHQSRQRWAQHKREENGKGQGDNREGNVRNPTYADGSRGTDAVRPGRIMPPRVLRGRCRSRAADSGL